MLSGVYAGIIFFSCDVVVCDGRNPFVFWGPRSEGPTKDSTLRSNLASRNVCLPCFPPFPSKNRVILHFLFDFLRGARLPAPQDSSVYTTHVAKSVARPTSPAGVNGRRDAFGDVLLCARPSGFRPGGGPFGIPAGDDSA